MGIEQIRARLLEIQNLLEGIQAGDEGFSTEQVEQISALNDEFEGLTVQLETAEKKENMKAKVTASAGRKVEAKAPAVRAEVGRTLNERFGGFNNSGEFLRAVHAFSVNGQIAKQFQNSAAFERTGEDGGFLVPEEISQGILKKFESSESLAASCSQLQLSGNNMTINVDESQPWNQGIQGYWLSEGQTITGTKNSFKQANFKLNKVGALVTATDELLDDATAFASYIQSAAPAALVNKVNGAIINGNGVGKPSGLIGSAFAVTVDAESMQTADTIVARNVINMYAHMFPAARSKAAWYINAQCEGQLWSMKDDLGNFIYLSPGSQMNQTPYGMLMGRPVYPLMSGIPELGDVGDIIFADLSYYYYASKVGGVKSAQSIHVNFDKEQTVFRFTMRVDGKCPFTSPVTTEFGSHAMSAIVLLQSR